MMLGRFARFAPSPRWRNICVGACKFFFFKLRPAQLTFQDRAVADRDASTLQVRQVPPITAGCTSSRSLTGISILKAA